MPAIHSVFILITITSLIVAQDFSDCVDSIEFILNQQAISYDAGRQFCVDNQALPASITSEEKFIRALDFFSSLGIDSDVFIGLLQDEDDLDGTNPLLYTWEDGTEINVGDFGSVASERPWAVGDPNDSNEQCVEIRRQVLLFNDVDCNDPSTFMLCERSCVVAEDGDVAITSIIFGVFILLSLIALLILFYQFRRLKSDIKGVKAQIEDLNYFFYK